MNNTSIPESVIHKKKNVINHHSFMGRIGYDPMGPNVDLSMFNDNSGWTECYGNNEE